MAGKLQGTVSKATESGDMLTDITVDQLADVPRDERTAGSCSGHHTIGIYPPAHSEPEMTFLAILDDACLRLTIVGDSARIMLGLSEGDEVTVEWQ